MSAWIREPVNSLTHLFGALLSVVGLLALIMKAVATTDSALAITAVVIFGISMILLYSVSAVYHMVIARDKVLFFLRRMDHSMIFVLIAGTYTPLCLISLNGSTIGWILFIVISSIALLGVVFKLVWFHAPRLLSTALYVAMGWLVIFFTPLLAPALGTSGMFYLILGGLFYTVGGVIYWLKPTFLEISKHVGFHEIFHIFIMFGTLFHYICIYEYVL